MGYKEFEAEHRRTVILIVLELAINYKMTLGAIRDNADSVGCPASAKQIKADCQWLHDNELVIYDGIACELTESGLDAINGLETVTGLHKPRPGELNDIKAVMVKQGIAKAKYTLRGEDGA